jgi:hypothetical protein
MAISAIAGLATAIGAAALPGVLAFFGATGLTAFAGYFAVGAGLSMVSRALAPKPNIGAQMRGITQTTREPASSRKIIYGRMRVGGQVVFISHSGDDNEFLNMAIVFATHEIQAYDEIWFNDNKIWTASGEFQDDWETYVDIDLKFGTSGQAHSDQLEDANTLWTEHHKLSGIAYIAFKLKWNADKFPQGVPNITAVIRGKKVYDPRTSTTAYSQNPALCLRDYMLDQSYGLGEVAANINNQSVIDAANLCDEQVALAGSGAQDRYQCNGVIDTANQIKANIEQLLASMGGRLTYSGGEYFVDGAGLLAVDAGSFVIGTTYRILTVGTTDFETIGASANTVDLEFTATGVGSGTGTAYVAENVSFTEADIISDIQTQTKQSRRGIYNGVKGIFVSEEKNFKVLDYPAQISSTYEAEDGDPIYLDMALPCVTNNRQAQRLAKIALLKSRQQTVITMTTNLKGLRVKVGDTIKVSNDHLNYDNKLFEVIDYSLAITEGALGVNLSCIETAAALYDWNTSDEEDFLSGGELDLYDGRTVANVGTITHTPIGLKGPDGRIITSVDLSWPVLGDAFVEFYIVTVEKDEDGNVFEYQTRENRLRIAELTIGSEYDFTVKAQNLIGVRSSGTTLNVASLAGDVTPPAKPTSLSLTGGVRQITAEWTNPTDDDFKHVEVYIANSDSIPASPHGVINGEEFVYPLAGDETTETQKYFWLKSVDYTGNKSDPTDSENEFAVVAATTDITDDVTDKIDEIISPIDYGVVGDGVNSDHVKLQEAFNSTEVGTNGLVLDGGNKTYVITDDINATGAFLRLRNFKFKLGTSYGAQGRINCDAGSGTTKMTVELDNVVFDGGRGTFKTGNEPWVSEPAVVVNAGSFVIGTEYYITELGDTNWTGIGAGANPTVNTKFTATGEGSGTGKAATTFFNYSTIQPELSAAFKVNADNVDTEVRITNCRFENIHAIAAIRIDSRGTNIIQDCVFKNISFNSVAVFHSKDGGVTQGGRTLISDVYTEDVGLLPDTFNVNGAAMNFSTTTACPQGSFNLVVTFGEYNITNASVKNYGSAGVTADRNKIFNASNITITNDSTSSFSNNPSGAFWLEDCELANVNNLHVDVTARSAKDTLADGFGMDNSLLQLYMTDGTKAFLNNVFLRTSSTTAYFNKLIRGSAQHKMNVNIQNFHVEGICRNLDDAVSFLLLPNSRVEQDIRLSHGYISHGDIKIDNPHHATIDDVYLEGGYDSTINVTDLTLNADEIVNGTTYAIVSLGDTVWTDIGYSGEDDPAVGDTFTANTSSATGTGTVIISTILYEIVSIGTTDFTTMGTPSNTVGLRFKPSGGGTGTGTVSLVYGNVVIFRAANADAGGSQIPDETHDFNITNSYIYGDVTNSTAITGSLNITNNKRIGSIASTSANNGGQTTVAHNGLITGSVQITSDGADGTAKVEIANNPLIQNLVLVDTTNTAVITGNVTNRRIEVGDVQNFQVVGNTAKTDRGEACILIKPTTSSVVLAGIVTGNNCLIKTGTTDAGYVSVGSGVTNVMEGLNNKLTVNWS